MDKNNTYAAERMQKILTKSKVTDLDAAAILNVSSQTVSEIRNGNGASFQVIMKFADAFSVSLDYLFGRVNEKETEKFFQDRKLFLRASFSRAAVVENWKVLTDEKTGKRIPYDDFITRKRQMAALKSIMPYPENYIYELLSEAGYSPYNDNRRRQLYILPVDQDILDGFSEAMKSLSDREKEIVE